ncbi:amidohydrolase family protein [Chloroflexota bacterium]
MIVDCHMHIWRYPEHFNKEVMLANQPPRRRDWPEEKFKLMWDNPVERYLEVMDEVVDRAIILGLKSRETFGVDVPNEYLAEVVRRHSDKLSWCCCVIPIKPGAADEVEKCIKEWGAIGVGELGPSYGSYYTNDRKAYPVYELCQSLDVPIIIHAGPSQPRRLRMKYSDIIAIDDVAIDFPNLKIVICHMGYYKYEDACFLMQKHDNVFADISWLPNLSGLERSTLPRYLPVVTFPYLHYAYPLLYSLGQPFGGTDKILFGTDWTSSPPKEAIQVLTGVNEYLKKYELPLIPEDTIHNILHENWKKVFNF